MEHFYDSREEASLAAARRIVAALTRRLDSQPEASLVVTGGSSPALCYAALADTDLAWSSVHVLLSDERWVPPTHVDSNEKLVRENLLQANAAAAQLHPMYDASSTIQERCEFLEESIRELPTPFASALIGMGEDGHIASLFPDAVNLADGLDIDGQALCLPVNTAASDQPRISMTLAALLQSEGIVLLFFGDAKHAVYERAKADPHAYPIAKLLSQNRVPVEVFWAP